MIDPVSTWSKIGDDLSAQTVAGRLIDWSRASGITLVRTSLLDETPGLAVGAERIANEAADAAANPSRE